jgi:hypothetical protein
MLKTSTVTQLELAFARRDRLHAQDNAPGIGQDCVAEKVSAESAGCACRPPAPAQEGRRRDEYQAFFCASTRTMDAISSAGS